MKKVIVFGSLNMDMTIESDYMPQSGETMDGHSFFTNPGGKGGNQGVACAKLGAKTHMIAQVGNDLFGEEIIKKLKEYGVECDKVGINNEYSTGAAVIVRCHGDNRIILSAGANHSMRIDQVWNDLKDLTAPGDIFLTQFECDYQTVIDSLKKAKGCDMYTILNPAPAKIIPDDAYKNIDLIIVNQTECEVLTGIYPTDDESCKQAFDIFMEKGAKSAIITLGIDGSVTKIGDDLIKVESYSVKNVDTTAAGDSYIGALASGLIRGDSLIDSMKFGTKAAALTVTKSGAQKSIPYLEQVNQYFKEDSL